MREGGGHDLRPLTPALSRWEKAQGTKVSVMSEREPTLVSPLEGKGWVGGAGCCPTCRLLCGQERNHGICQK